MNIENEIWKDFPGQEGLYKVSNYGRVMSFKRESEGRLMSKSIKPNGYPFVYIYNTKNSYNIHRLVATLFVPNPYSKLEVNHIDGNKLNNFYKNLEWNTRSENAKHAAENGLYKTGGQVGTKLSSDNVLDIRRLHSKGLSQTHISKIYGVSNDLISKIINKKRWAHVIEANISIQNLQIA